MTQLSLPADYSDVQLGVLHTVPVFNPARASPAASQLNGVMRS